jgi:hypothetical protein
VVSGALTVTSTGGAWPSLQLMNNVVGGTFDDTAATGTIRSTGPARTWTPVVKLGATTVTTTGAAGTATRQPDSSIKYHMGFTISNENAGTGALTVTGAPYQCADFGRAILGGSSYLGLTGAPLVSAATAGGGFTFSQSGATGYTALNETNTQAGTIVVADVVCPAT